jgi:LPXTG-site transpeptidase (sortase) family protein
VIEFQTPAGSYRYKVESTGIVKPDNVAVLRASRHPEMTLVTCYPFYYVGSAPDPLHREGAPGGPASGPEVQCRRRL